ncbi:hypothetical protein IIW29_02265, partial [Candidatus Saccharibacteria bacterium]|nr:hypothetical protein [Candidatus Saccharibacteria bacterium]
MVRAFRTKGILAVAIGVVLMLMAIITSGVASATTNLRAGTLKPEQLEEFAQNNVLYYDPTACLDNSMSNVPPDGDQITWIGDSYSVSAHAIIEDKFPGISFGNGIENSSSYIQSNKGVSDRYGGGEANPPALTILKRLTEAGELKPYLVMAVGTNAGWTDEEVSEFENIMSSYPDTKVVFVTAKAKAHLMSDDNGTNDRLRALANGNDNYYLADWAVAYDDSYFANNSTHPDANGGYEKWVEVIYDAIPKTTTTNGSLSGTGNFAKILSAKNADKSFFNGSGDVPLLNHSFEKAKAALELRFLMGGNQNLYSEPLDARDGTLYIDIPKWADRVVMAIRTGNESEIAQSVREFAQEIRNLYIRRNRSIMYVQNLLLTVINVVSLTEDKENQIV